MMSSDALVLGRHYRLCLTLTVTDLPNARVHNKPQGANTIHSLLYCTESCITKTRVVRETITEIICELNYWTTA